MSRQQLTATHLAPENPACRGRYHNTAAASNVVGLFVDSALFLWLAFGGLAYLPGQIVGKAWMTVLAVALLAAGRRAYRARRATT